jgi:hypothetical protein
MANRNFQPGAKALERETVKLYAKFTVGSANAITVNRGTGITSIARTAAGKVTITLDDVYTNFLSVNVIKLNASAAAEALLPCLVSEAVASTKTVVIGFSNAAVPAYTDLTDGDVVYVELTLKNSTI